MEQDLINGKGKGNCHKYYDSTGKMCRNNHQHLSNCRDWTLTSFMDLGDKFCINKIIENIGTTNHINRVKIISSAIDLVQNDEFRSKYPDLTRDIQNELSNNRIFIYQHDEIKKKYNALSRNVQLNNDSYNESMMRKMHKEESLL